MVAAAVAQMVVAVVLAVGQGTNEADVRSVRTLAPAGAVAQSPVSTTTTAPPPPVAVELPPPSAAPGAPAPPAAGAVFGVIGAGPGGKARADLRDAAGNTWHSEASSTGAYRFDGLAPGQYQLILSAESAPAPCTPDGTCIGSAMSMSKRVIEISPGAEIREDYAAYGPTGPPLSTTTTTAPTTVSPTTTSTTTP